MPEPDKTIADQIADHLSRIFRHMLPGVIVLGAARLAHPGWFLSFTLSDGWHVAVLATVSLVVGNVWYVLHRFTIHQLIDLFLFTIRERTPTGYWHWLADFVHRAFRAEESIPKLRAHLWARSSQIILMFIVSEVALTFALWHEKDTPFESYRPEILWACLGVFAFAFWQHSICDHIDRVTVDLHTPPHKSTNPPTPCSPPSQPSSPASPLPTPPRTRSLPRP